MCAGMFMAVLDIQIVATSLPTIQDALEIRPDQMSWIQTSYLIAEVVAIPLTGYLTRALTMRWLSVATLTLFTLASIGCAFSGSHGAARLAHRAGLRRRPPDPQVFAAGFLLFPCAARRSPPRWQACWPCSRRPSARSSAAGSPIPIAGRGCS